MKRIKYYDFLRVVCFLFIIFYHMTIQLVINGIYSVEEVGSFYCNSNMHIAKLAVAVFFMLSGAGLTIGAEKGFELGKFYKKRFIRLLIPFYVTTLLYQAVYYAVYRTFRVNGDAPVWRIVFTVLGMDEWVSMHGIQTFSTGIGEWFLGLLILLYLVFPLFRYCMQKAPKLFFVFMTCVYMVVVYHYEADVPPIHMSAVAKGYEFVIGMYLGKYFQKFPDKYCLFSVPVTVFFFACDRTLPINEAVKITVFAVAFFVSFSYLEPLLERRECRLVSFVSGISYELFLVHHMIIYMVTPRLAIYVAGIKRVTALYLLEGALMLFFALIVKFCSDFFIKKIHTKVKIN